MRPGGLRGSFRHKLLVIFLLMGMVPALALTVFYLRYLVGSVELWQNPGVEALLESSLGLARASLAPLERDAEKAATGIAADGRLPALLGAGDRGGVEGIIEEVLPPEGAAWGENVAFAALLKREVAGEVGPRGASARGIWTTWASAGPAPHDSLMTRLPPTGAAALETERGVVWCVKTVGAGPLGGVAVGEEGPGVLAPHEAGPLPVDWLVVAGWRLDPATAERARSLVEGLPLYRSLGAYKRVRLRAIWTVTGILFVLLAVSSWLVARALAGTLSRPIVKLVEGTRRVATGDYDHRVEVETSDELGRLVTAFNRMTGELRDQAEKLKQAERLAAWREIARRVAHQIKNPLTPIQLSVHRLRSLERPSGSREAHLLEECLAAVTGEVKNLRRIADEFSRFARLPEPRPEKMDLGALVREVAELYHTGHSTIRLRLEIEPGLPPALLDPDLTRQALSNLVKNAVEAMPEGGELLVRARLQGPRFRLEISDTGEGIPPEVRGRLFAPYLTTKPGGTGLGLALAHRMVVDQGGTLEVRSEEGRGTTFVIEFPLTDAG